METGEEFELSVSQRAQHAVVAVRGELDAATGPTLFDAVSTLASDGLAGIVIDLEGVTFVDSRGLSALLDSHRRVSERDMTLRVVNRQPAIERLFRITGVDAVLVDGDTPS